MEHQQTKKDKRLDASHRDSIVALEALLDMRHSNASQPAVTPTHQGQQASATTCSEVTDISAIMSPGVKPNQVSSDSATNSKVSLNCSSEFSNDVVVKNATHKNEIPHAVPASFLESTTSISSFHGSTPGRDLLQKATDSLSFTNPATIYRREHMDFSSAEASSPILSSLPAEHISTNDNNYASIPVAATKTPQNVTSLFPDHLNPPILSCPESNSKSTNKNTLIATPAMPALNGNNNALPSSPPANMKSEAKHQHEQDTITSEMVRAEEVQAALRSKPQRGRKRDNLSEMERLELTRTRNREHAKSTRIRKKARYQELLELEKENQAYIELEALQSNRRATLIAFMKLRSDEELSSSILISPLREEWCQILQDPVQFTFSPTLAEANPTSARQPGLVIMNQYDTYIRENIRIEHRAAHRNHRISLRFEVRDSFAGIAITADVAFAQYDIIASLSEDTGIGTGVLRVTYASQSSKIRSISSCTTFNFDVFKTCKKEQSFQEMFASHVSCFGRMLACHCSFPSVISLDNNAVLDGASPSTVPSCSIAASDKREFDNNSLKEMRKPDNEREGCQDDGNNGPGMNIEESVRSKKSG